MRDCPEVKKSFGACFNCGEEGHSKADCQNERVEREFTGECRNCGEVGHRVADCPTKPAAKCKACGEEGHAASECGKNRITIGVQDLSLEEAWKAVEDADKEKDVDDIKKVSPPCQSVYYWRALTLLLPGDPDLRQSVPGRDFRRA